MTTDERIKAAAAELSAALTEGGKEYLVSASGIDVTRLDSPQPQIVWSVRVEETSKRVIAP